MLRRTPLIFVLAYALVAVYVTYQFYQAWFRPAEALKTARKRSSSLPEWHPLKDYYLNQVSQEHNWIVWNRVMYTLGEMVILIILGFVIASRLLSR